MNSVLIVIFIISIIGYILNDFDLFGKVLIESLDKSIKLVFDIGLILIFWSGLFNILIKSNVLKKFKKFFKPLFNFIYPNVNYDDESFELILTNYLFNLLGLGMGSTSSALMTIESLEKKNNYKTIETFVVLNVACFSVVPMSLVSFRIKNNGTVSISLIFGFVFLSLLVHITGIILDKVIK